MHRIQRFRIFIHKCLWFFLSLNSEIQTRENALFLLDRVATQIRTAWDKLCVSGPVVPWDQWVGYTMEDLSGPRVRDNVFSCSATLLGPPKDQCNNNASTLPPSNPDQTHCNFPVILKTFISFFMCVWLGLEINSVGHWTSRAREFWCMR